MAMLDSKIVCCTATADARQQSQLLSRKWRCQTAKSFAAQQRRMLDSKASCCLGNGDARQQKRLPHSNGGNWTPKPAPAYQIGSLHSTDFARLPPSPNTPPSG